MNHLFRFVFVGMLLLLAAAPLTAQNTSGAEPLERFIGQVARYWAAGDAAALVELAPADSRIVLDLGENLGTVHIRHAAAALRALFAERETASLRTLRVTVAGGRPPRGFGELAWTSRSRGMSDPQTGTLYVGTVWQENGWRVRELRILR
jgi:hypothetical protein